MQQIAFYLKKFENVGLQESRIKKVIIHAVKDITNIDVLVSEIEVLNTVIKINKVGVEKTEIFLHRAEIEKRILNEVDMKRGVR